MNFETKMVAPDQEHIKEAAALIKTGEVVGMPTETVYGLAADAYNIEAIKKVFLAKGRPQDNPLIVHIASTNQIADLVLEVPETAALLAKTFW